jgi:hypothetical protein
MSINYSWMPISNNNDMERVGAMQFERNKFKGRARIAGKIYEKKTWIFSLVSILIIVAQGRYGKY